MIASGSSPSTDFTTIVAALHAFQVVHFACIAGITWLFYDWSLTIRKEVQHFWTGGWSLLRVLYFLNRYIAAANMIITTLTYIYPISSEFCRITQWYQITGNCLQVWGLWAILMLRTHALYKLKLIKVSMIVLFVLAATAMMTITVETGLKTPVSNEPFPGVYFCSSQPTYHRQKGIGFFWSWWVPAIIVETYLFILALIQLVWNIKFMRKRALLFGGRPRLYVEVMLRDSIWYFLAIIEVDLATMFIWQHPTGHVIGGAQWTNALYTSFFAFVSSRMSFDLLELMNRKMDGHLDTSTAAIFSSQQVGPGEMQFASPMHPEAVDNENY